MSSVAPAAQIPAGGESFSAVDPPPNKLQDAAALFVLEPKGSWLHCGYHMTTAMVGPALLSLPFAIALLGWVGGILILVSAGVVTFYSYILLSLVLEHHAVHGKRQLRFRDMAHDILGPVWGRYYVGPLQIGACFASVVTCTLLGGQSLKFIYLLAKPDGSLQLSHFITIFGSFTLILAQIPSFHSLRHINLVSLLLCLAYSACAAAGAIYIGHSKDAPPRDYSLTGVGVNRSFGAINAISIICTTFGNAVVPEIQATIAAPVKGKMVKGLLVCYAVIASTYFSVGLSGYWAFGNQSQGSVLLNFMATDKLLIPKWFLLMTNIFAATQVSFVNLVYLQPTNIIIERRFSDPRKGQLSIRNVVPRVIMRSLTVVVATTLAAMLPFFGDIMALGGAFAAFPLDFILPMIFYNLTFKPSKRSKIFWINTVIGVVSTGLAIVAAVTSTRQIILDAKTYRLFANV